MYRILMIVFFGMGSFAFAEPVYFTGTLGGKTKVAMRIDDTTGTTIKGVYFYLKNGQDLLLQGTKEKDGSLRLKEFGDAQGLEKNQPTGSWHLYILNAQMKGEWSNPQNTKRLQVDMTEAVGMKPEGFEGLRPIGAKNKPSKIALPPPKAFAELFVDFAASKTKILEVVFPKQVASSREKNIKPTGDCRAIYNPDEFQTDAVIWKLTGTKLKVWTEYPQAFKTCNISTEIEAKKLAPWLDPKGPLGKFASPDPKDVSDWLKRHEECQHWAGEEPYDKARAEEIAKAVQKIRCDRLEEEAEVLIKKYGEASSEGRALKEALR